MQKETLDKKIELLKSEIENAELMMGFYNWVAEGLEAKGEKKQGAEYRVKHDQVKQAKEFNEKFLEYVSTL